MKLSPVNAVTPQGVVQNATLEICDGKIKSLTPGAAPAPADTPWAVPAFIDLHIHGMGGFGPEQNLPETLLQLSNVLARQGVGVFCPTLYGAAPQVLARQLRTLAPALGRETGSRMLGFHLEGPFLSPDKPGVMRLSDIVPPRIEDMEQLYEAAGGKIAIITLAPELPGIESVIRFCHAHHIIVQAGHTNATYEQMQRAFDWGVHRVTHLGNAMRGLHHREPGALGFSLLEPQMGCEVIADGRHVHLALLSWLRRVKPMEQITAVTDALRPTGQPVGPFIANGEEVHLQEGVWKRLADGVTAGSALTMAGAFKQLIAAGYSVEQASQCTSTNAAHLCALEQGMLQVGAPADLVLLTPNFQVCVVYLRGQAVS